MKKNRVQKALRKKKFLGGFNLSPEQIAAAKKTAAEVSARKAAEPAPAPASAPASQPRINAVATSPYPAMETVNTPFGAVQYPIPGIGLPTPVEPPTPEPELPPDPRIGSVTNTAPEGKPPQVEIARGTPFVVSKPETAMADDTIALDEAKTIAPQTDVGQQTIAPQRAYAQSYRAAQGAAPTDFNTQQINAEQVQSLDPTKAAQGEVTRIAEADAPTLTERAKAAERVKEAEQAALAGDVSFIEDTRSIIDRVTGETAQVASTKEAEAAQRAFITGDPAPDGEAAQVMMLYDYDQAQQREIRGAQAKAKVLSDLKASGIPDEEAQGLAEDPARLAKALEGIEDDGIKTRLSGLSREALVSTQMETLLAGMEDGETPVWARPAVAAVEAKLAQRGMSASTVGRDALFNAIIQSAIPIAQSNAQAIQTATSQDKTLAGQFIIKNAEFKQQMDLANLSNDQQMRLANLSALNAAEGQNLNARQQTELANLQTRLNTNIKQAEIAATMNQAQLNVDQQTAVSNAMTVARVDMAKFSSAQQVELANSKFMQTATLTDFNARQQEAMQNATLMAQMDLATADQQTKLAVENARNFLTMDMANLSNEQQVNVFDQQMRQQKMLTNAAATNSARQFNAASENQKNQFMTNLAAQMEQFNAAAKSSARQFAKSEINKVSALNAQNALAARQAQAQLNTQIDQFNSQIDFNRDQWNAANAQAVAQSNVEWRRKANLSNTAAQNSSNQMSAQMQFNLDSAEQAFLWQNLRDEAAYLRQSYENEEQRKTSLYATALGNEAAAEKGNVGTNTIKDWVTKIFT
tara:strand:+ start:2260 stop:4689 length:2430 start_codon:yes stop_codon:yes gene_type:complete